MIFNELKQIRFKSNSATYINGVYRQWRTHGGRRTKGELLDFPCAL